MDDECAHQAGIAEANFGFGRMDVNIDFAGRQRDEKREQRMAIARQIIRIGGANRADQHLVPHRPPVDEKVLAERVRAAQRRQRGKAFDGDAFARGMNGDRVGAKVGAENVAETHQPAGGAGQRRGKAERRALLTRKRKSDISAAHGETAQRLTDGVCLGAIGFEKFQACRRRVKKVMHLHARAAAKRRRLEARFYAGVDFNQPGVRLLTVAARDGKTRHSADRGQRFAAKPQRVDRDKIVVVEL